ncbi:alkaline phosphatase D family protein [Actinokineospora auranticolor]|uniref:Phosphodiesterase/alkaline phosphatase D-like protein n=1 Tax=Actinokineospora auranticolor TaxID=155976 RepID=A0A2S6GUJ4_9PSEU|nr:alkaline phosphatase D family protein [Actinokineospora auranticolor]PPK68874.1 phosphodiesterase/alkaline phosphatase D-like protein [Actinokineospora auranticolor]
MPELLLGPILRHVDSTSATIWVETDAACEVTIAGRTAHTFEVTGHHYALVVLTGLAPASVTEYDVRLDGKTHWPQPGSDFPPSRIRTLPDGGDDDFLLLFGSCRKPESDDPTEHRLWGTDALAAYAVRMASEEEVDWPDSLVLLGDQVYADETSKATQAWIADRRDPDKPPGTEVADFTEYVRLYHEAWSTDLVRWLFATVPVSMVFDDHDVRDDWNTSQTWRDTIEQTSWWAARERGALVSYWIYQHIGNLSPDELAEDETYRKVTSADGDAADVLGAFADVATREYNGRKGVRWSYRRDFGNVRLLVIDTRSGRILKDGQRSMVGDGEFEWIEANAANDEVAGHYDHLLIGSSLPWLMPHVISHVQSMNEVACRRTDWRGRLAEKLRQAADLEHWPSFRQSSDRLTRLVRRIAEGSAATVCVLSGDVHHVYAAEATFDRPVNARVYQLTCSPVHNAVERYMRPLFRLGWWQPLARVLRWWMYRSPEIEPLPVDWRKVSGPFFGNAVATLRVRGRASDLVIECADAGPDGPRLRPLPTVPLTAAHPR